MSLRTGQVLLVRRGALGDLILTLPLLSVLKTLYPRSALHILGPSGLWSVIAGRVVEGVHDLEEFDLAGLYVRGGEVSSRVRKFFAAFDRILYIGVDPEGTIRDHLEQCVPGRGRILSPFPSPGANVHVSDHLVGQLSDCGFQGATPLPLVCLRQDDSLQGIRVLRERKLPAERPLLALHPGSGSPRKNWPWAGFQEIIRRCRERGLASPLVVLGEAERRGMDPGVLEFLPTEVPRFCCLPLGHVAGVLANCHLYLGNDSGITHLAAALGVPTLALFFTTDPSVWGPRGGHSTIFSFPASRASAGGSVARQVQAVWAGVEEILGTEPSLH